MSFGNQVIPQSVPASVLRVTRLLGDSEKEVMVFVIEERKLSCRLRPEDMDVKK